MKSFLYFFWELASQIVEDRQNSHLQNPDTTLVHSLYNAVNHVLYHLVCFCQWLSNKVYHILLYERD